MTDNRVENTPQSLQVPSVKERVSFSMTAWLTILWIVVFRELSILIILSGLVVAVGVQWIFPMPRVGTQWRIRFLPLLRLIVRFLWDAAVSGVQVAWIVLSGKHVKTGIVRVDVHSCDPVHMTILSALTSLVPGTIVVNIDKTQGRMYLHVLDLDAAGGRQGVREATKKQEERILRAVARTAVLRKLGVESPLSASTLRRGASREAIAETGREESA